MANNLLGASGNSPKPKIGRGTPHLRTSGDLPRQDPTAPQPLTFSQERMLILNYPEIRESTRRRRYLRFLRLYFKTDKDYQAIDRRHLGLTTLVQRRMIVMIFANLRSLIEQMNEIFDLFGVERESLFFCFALRGINHDCMQRCGKLFTASAIETSIEVIDTVSHLTYATQGGDRVLTRKMTQEWPEWGILYYSEQYSKRFGREEENRTGGTTVVGSDDTSTHDGFETEREDGSPETNPFSRSRESNSNGYEEAHSSLLGSCSRTRRGSGLNKSLLGIICGDDFRRDDEVIVTITSLDETEAQGVRPAGSQPNAKDITMAPIEYQGSTDKSHETDDEDASFQTAASRVVDAAENGSVRKKDVRRGYGA